MKLEIFLLFIAISALFMIGVLEMKVVSNFENKMSDNGLCKVIDSRNLEEFEWVHCGSLNEITTK